MLGLCLEAITRLNCSHDELEVIVVDDDAFNEKADSASGLSGGHCCETVERVVSHYRSRLDIVLVRQRNAGPAAARNAGAARARGLFLAFTDDDCLAHPEWLRILADRLKEAPDCAVGGFTINALSENPYAVVSQRLIDYLYASYNVDAEQARFLTSNNFAVRREHFLALGGFDSSFSRAGGEDREFCHRWLCRGHRLRYCQEACVYHFPTPTLRAFCRQQFNYGRGSYRYHLKLSEKSKKHRGRESWIFYVDLLMSSLRSPCKSPRTAIALAMLIFLSQGANVCGRLLARMRD